MADLGTAYVNIVPKAQGISKNIEGVINPGAESAGSSAGKKVGSSLLGTMAKIVSAAAVGKIIKDAFSAGGDIQQSFGGLETIYGDAAEAAKAYALEAASAGISANNYAEQAVSFGAALKKAFGGDTTAAMEAANTAIMDMADNSAKMGTDIGSVQAAYQGFAKQNYTMLDNLKLGYGGTKSEMDRLIRDAEKLDSSFSVTHKKTKKGADEITYSYGDIVEAIHIVQGDLGLTGVAAAEAETTLTGSLGAVKASYQNLLAAMTTGEGLDTALQNFAKSGGSLLTNIMKMMQPLAQQLPTVITSIFSTLGPQMVPMAVDIVNSLVQGFISSLPALITGGVDMLLALIQGITTALPQLIDAVIAIIPQVVNALIAALPQLMTAGIELLMAIINGVVQSLPLLIAMAQKLIPQITSTLLANLPELLSAGLQILMAIINGIVNNLPQLISAITEMIPQIASAIIQNLPLLISTGMQILLAVLSGILQVIPQLLQFVPQLFQKCKTAFSGIDWKSLGSQIINGIVNGIKTGATQIFNSLKDLAKNALSKAKEALGIGSPSKLFAQEVGRWIPPGVAMGIDDNLMPIQDSINGMVRVAAADFATASGAPAIGQTQQNNAMDYDRLAAAIASRPIEIVGDTNKIFKVVRKQNNVITKATNYNPLAVGV